MRPARATASLARERGREREVAIVGDERPAVGEQRLLHHRMPAALDDEVERAVDLGPHVVPLDRELRQRRRHVERRQRFRRFLDRAAAAVTCAASRSKVSSSMPSARSAALAIFASSSPSSVVVKRTWPASVCGG